MNIRVLAPEAIPTLPELSMLSMDCQGVAQPIPNIPIVLRPVIEVKNVRSIASWMLPGVDREASVAVCRMGLGNTPLACVNRKDHSRPISLTWLRGSPRLARYVAA